ncbi:hypothetical protein HKX48_000104 [Thoreauomyces humboldtii]|nr:hypothetical protein HKX48_000104 [Thoreauomyces humboldtii]
MLFLRSLLVALPFLGAALATPIASSRTAAVKRDDAAATYFHKGHDLSSVGLNDDVYYDSANNWEARPVEDILKEGGATTVRLRLWVADNGLYNLTYTLDLAKRFVNAGNKFYLDFHFSDNWTDPVKNVAPASWRTDLPGASAAIRSYVKDTLVAFHEAGVDPDIVSLGNEIRNGMAWPLGRVDPDLTGAAGSANYTDFATIWASARQGVRDAVTLGTGSPEVMIHIDNGWDKALQERWFANLVGTGIVSVDDFDIQGFSFYPFYTPHATIAALEDNLNNLAAIYGKKLMVAETNWPVVCDGKYVPMPKLSEPSIPVSVAGQRTWMDRVLNVLYNVKGGAGVFYWEPTWLENGALGSACEDNLLFDPNGNSRDSTWMYHNSD